MSFKSVTRNNMDCGDCVATGNHCCKAYVPFSHQDVELMKHFAKELGIQNVVVAPFPRRKKEYIITTSDIIDKVLEDPFAATENCIFMAEDGLCRIYENRPSICRIFGTTVMPCKQEDFEEEPRQEGHGQEESETNSLF